MNLPAPTVVVCESNRTRADLYGLWLDDHEVRRALTSTQLDEEFDAEVAVLVMDHSFGDDGAESILERPESQTSHCRTLGIRDRSTAIPESVYDRELERPVFESDLVERVETLFRRANYHLLLERYFRTTVVISTYEWRAEDESAEDESAEDDRYGRLRDRADRLQDLLNRLRPRLSNEDACAVASDITIAEVPDVDELTESKYRPDACSQCGQDWSEPIDGGESAAKLGAYVWRCVNCGHVDMRADPSYRHIGSYRR